MNIQKRLGLPIIFVIASLLGAIFTYFRIPAYGFMLVGVLTGFAQSNLLSVKVWINKLVVISGITIGFGVTIWPYDTHSIVATACVGVFALQVYGIVSGVLGRLVYTFLETVLCMRREIFPSGIF